MRDLFRKILQDTQIQEIVNSLKKDRQHPVKRLLFNDNELRDVYYNTEFSLKNVLQKDHQWLSQQKNRLANVDDFSSPSSCLGEIRAYGYLLGAQFSIVPVKEQKGTSTPDFQISGKYGDKIEIEVNAKQYQEEESASLTETNSAVNHELVEHGVITETVITPFGKPKAGESVTENAISKIRGIKGKEEQFSQELPSILWLDFQDELWRLCPKVDSMYPMDCRGGDFYSGELWYAFYGKKNLPIFESDSIERRAVRSNVVMRHEGRYWSQSKVDAAIVSFPRHTVVLENQEAVNPIPSWFWEQFTCVRWFNTKHSWMNWPEKRLGCRVDIEHARIRVLNNLGVYHW